MSEKLLEKGKSSNIDNIANKNIKLLKDDILFFKEDILKNLSSIQKSFDSQKEEIRSKINGKFLLYDETLTKLNNNFSELKKLVENNNFMKEKVNNFENFKNEISKMSSENNIKLNILEKETTNNFYRIDKILNTSIIYPRIIGFNSKFKSFHDYIDYTLNQINSYEIFKSQIELDLNNFKSKIEKMIKSIQFKIECSINDSHQIVKNGVKENELSIKDYIIAKIYDVQVKNAEFEQKINKNFEEMNSYLNSYQEKMKLFNEKIEEKINLNLFNEEKSTIYQCIDAKCKENKDELIERINKLEEYKESHEKNCSLQNKIIERKVQRNNSSLSVFPENHPEIDLIDMIEREKERERSLNNIINDINIIQDKKDINVNNIEEKNNFKLEKEKENDILIKQNNFTEMNNSPILNNDNRIKLKKESIHKNSLTSHENNSNINNNFSKHTQNFEKPNKSLYKLRISLQDINAQFNSANMNENNDSKNNSKDNCYNQNRPLTIPINNEINNFNSLLSYTYKNQLKKMIESKIIIKPLCIHKKGIKYLYDDLDFKNVKKEKNNTEEVNKKIKGKKSDERKKIWERLYSQKKKRKSSLNILNNYLMSYKSHNDYKTNNRIHISRSSQNFINKLMKC